jgi:hypothetical protein
MTAPSLKNPKTQTDESRGKQPAFPPPLRPRPLLYVVLWIVFVAWLGTLVWMRLRTVKRPAPQPTPVPQILPR